MEDLESPLILYTSIKTPFKRYVLFRGTIFGLLGGFIILFGGFLSTGVLTVWGLPIFLLGIGLIAFGLIPYRKLQRLETSPNEMHISPKMELNFYNKKRPVFSASLKGMTKIEYIEQKNIYGICIWFKDRGKILFPYFSHRSFDELQEFLARNNENH